MRTEGLERTYQKSIPGKGNRKCKDTNLERFGSSVNQRVVGDKGESGRDHDHRELNELWKGI